MPPRAKESNNDVLGELRALQDRVVDRIRELEPLEQELAELRKTAETFGLDLAKKSTQTRAKPAAKRTAPKTSGTGRRRRRARAGTGSRAEQVAQLVNEQPGITVPELGKALGVDSTGLYRVIRQLEDAGRVTKQGRQLQPVSAGRNTADTAEQE